jgi:hypothetical protein
MSPILRSSNIFVSKTCLLLLLSFLVFFSSSTSKSDWCPIYSLSGFFGSACPSQSVYSCPGPWVCLIPCTYEPCLENPCGELTLVAMRKGIYILLIVSLLWERDASAKHHVAPGNKAQNRNPRSVFGFEGRSQCCTNFRIVEGMLEGRRYLGVVHSQHGKGLFLRGGCAEGTSHEDQLMDVNRTMELIERNLQEIVGKAELRKIVSERPLNLYWGTATTGRPHVGYLVPMCKVQDMLLRSQKRTDSPVLILRLSRADRRFPGCWLPCYGPFRRPPRLSGQHEGAVGTSCSQVHTNLPMAWSKLHQFAWSRDEI